jgi:hypothetical protein
MTSTYNEVKLLPLQAVEGHRWVSSEVEHHLHIKSKATSVGGRGSLQVFPVRYEHYVDRKSKAVPVTGRGHLWACEMLRIPHHIDSSRMAVTLTASSIGRPLLLRNISYFCLWYSFLAEAEETPGLRGVGRIW